MSLWRFNSERDDVFFESSSHSSVLFAHDLFRKTEYPPRIKSEGRLFRIMLCTTMAQAESKKNARLPDATCGKICGAVMTSGSLSGSSSGHAAPSRCRRDHFRRTFVRFPLRIVGGLLPGLFHEAKQLAVHGVVAGGDIAFG